MHFPAPLIPARFLERRQRFLALVELPDHRRVWVHVPTTGAMAGCAYPGQEILLTDALRPGRKTAYTWRFVRPPRLSLWHRDLIRREAKMSNPAPTREDYDSLIYELATLESELGQTQKLLEAPKKVSWWRRYWTAGLDR